MDKHTLNLITEELKAKYPSAKCELEFSSAFELLIATILSAQCTDKRVNTVTNALFKTAKTPAEFASMEYADLEKMIFSCGFYKNKAKNIIDCARTLLIEHGGQVPDSFEKLILLPGVGRKTANVVMSNAFGGNNIAVDTHVFRVSKRLGLASGNTPEKVEQDLMNLLDEKDYSMMHHLLIFHGRYCCKSQNPDCLNCPVTQCCNFYTKQEVKQK